MGRSSRELVRLEAGVLGFFGIRRRRIGAGAAPRGGDSATGVAVDETRLSALESGTTGTVVAAGGPPQVRARLASLGFVPGTEVTMVQNRGQGPLIVELRGTRIALGRREADRVRLAQSREVAGQRGDEPR
jgi:ferrous iron transport protein A